MVLDILMILPRPSSFICGITACEQSHALDKLTAMHRFQSSIVIVSAGDKRNVTPPALLTSAAIGPKRHLISFIAR